MSAETTTKTSTQLILDAFTKVDDVTERIDAIAPPSVVDIDGWKRARDGHPAHLRGPAPLQELLETIEIREATRQASSQLVAGDRGSGKTTVLLQLKQALTADFVVLSIDAADFREVSSDVTFESLLVTLVTAVGEAARGEIGDRSMNAITSFSSRLRDLLGAVVDLDKPLDLKVSRVQLRSGSPFSTRVKERLIERQGPLIELFRQYMADLVATLEGERPVLLVDGLEKISVVVDESANAYRALTGIFANHAAELAIANMHVVYVVPPQALVIAPQLTSTFNVRTIPCVRISSPPPDRHPDTDGVAALTAVLAARVDLEVLFGSGDSEAVAELVLASGGHLRVLLLLAAATLQRAYAAAKSGGLSLPIPAQLARESTAEFARHRRNSAKRIHPLLEKVATNGHIIGLSKEEIDLVAIALDQEHLLAYENGDTWYDVHPLVRPILAN